jgi:hypothetical protein
VFLLKIDQAGFAEPSTYQGLEGKIQDIFLPLKLPPTIIMNDAVWAALGHKPQKEKELILTLGFGVGGALWIK